MTSTQDRRGPGGEIVWVAARTGVAILAGFVTYFVAGEGGPDGFAIMVAVAVALGVWVGLEVLRRVFYRRSTG